MRRGELLTTKPVKVVKPVQVRQTVPESRPLLRHLLHNLVRSKLDLMLHQLLFRS